nr:hypothetical protein [Actinomycetota bacterium]
MTNQNHDELDDAIGAWRRFIDSPSFSSAPVELRLNALAQAGDLYHARYSARKAPEDLDELLILTDAAVKLAPPNAPDRGRYLNNLATLREVRFHETRDPKDIGGAIAAFEQAVAAGPPSVHLSKLFVHLGTALVQRYSLLG